MEKNMQNEITEDLLFAVHQALRHDISKLNRIRKIIFDDGHEATVVYADEIADKVTVTWVNPEA